MRPVVDEITVVCYDIADDRRRYRVVRILEGYGVRAQESVFECWLVPAERRKLYQALRAQVAAGQDLIAFYTLSGQDVSRVILLGRNAALAENVGSVVV